MGFVDYCKAEFHKKEIKFRMRDVAVVVGMKRRVRWVFKGDSNFMLNV